MFDFLKKKNNMEYVKMDKKSYKTYTSGFHAMETQYFSLTWKKFFLDKKVKEKVIHYNNMYIKGDFVDNKDFFKDKLVFGIDPYCKRPDPVSIDYEYLDDISNVLFCGSMGTGSSVFTKQTIVKLLESNSMARAIVCDPVHDAHDWNNVEKLPNLINANNHSLMIKDVIKIIENEIDYRKNNTPIKDNHLFWIIDHFHYLSGNDLKDIINLMPKLQQYNIHLIAISQNLVSIGSIEHYLSHFFITKQNQVSMFGINQFDSSQVPNGTFMGKNGLITIFDDYERLNGKEYNHNLNNVFYNDSSSIDHILNVKKFKILSMDILDNKMYSEEEKRNKLTDLYINDYLINNINIDYQNLPLIIKNNLLPARVILANINKVNDQIKL